MVAAVTGTAPQPKCSTPDCEETRSSPSTPAPASRSGAVGCPPLRSPPCSRAGLRSGGRGWFTHTAHLGKVGLRIRQHAPLVIRVRQAAEFPDSRFWPHLSTLVEGQLLELPAVPFCMWSLPKGLLSTGKTWSVWQKERPQGGGVPARSSLPSTAAE